MAALRADRQARGRPAGPGEARMAAPARTRRGRAVAVQTRTLSDMVFQRRGMSSADMTTLAESRAVSCALRIATRLLKSRWLGLEASSRCLAFSRAKPACIVVLRPPNSISVPLKARMAAFAFDVVLKATKPYPSDLELFLLSVNIRAYKGSYFANKSLKFFLSIVQGRPLTCISVLITSLFLRRAGVGDCIIPSTSWTESRGS